MIAIVLVVIIGIITAVLTYLSFTDDSYLDWFDKILSGIMAFLMGLVGSFVSGLIFIGLPQLDTGWCDVKEREILTLQDGIGTSGQFFLGIGDLGSSGNYSFYLADEDGAKQLYVRDASSVKVFDNAEKPVAWQLENCRLKHLSWFAPYMGEGNGQINKLYVPPGTIKTDMVLDAK